MVISSLHHCRHGHIIVTSLSYRHHIVIVRVRIGTRAHMQKPFACVHTYTWSAFAAFFGPIPRPVTHCTFCSVPCPLAMAEPALLWCADDMRAREDGRYEYVPCPLFPPVAEAEMPQWLSPLARSRLRMMSATVHTNPTVGNIYIGDCRESMQWAGENVGYVIDASDGTSDPRLHHPPSHPVHCPMDQNPHRAHKDSKIRSPRDSQVTHGGGTGDVLFCQELCVECFVHTAVVVYQQASAA